MGLYTTADRDAVKSAMIAAATDGIASVSIGGQSVQSYSLDELRKILEMIQQDLASSQPRGGMRMIKTIPPAAG